MITEHSLRLVHLDNLNKVGRLIPLGCYGQRQATRQRCVSKFVGLDDEVFCIINAVKQLWGVASAESPEICCYGESAWQVA